MNSVKTAVFLLAAVAAAALCQDAPKQLTKPEALNAAVTKVQPNYPLIARQLRLQGDVELRATISETGAVEKVEIVSGNPVLTRPASDALKRWKFSPFTAGGKPVKAVAPVVFTFEL